MAKAKEIEKKDKKDNKKVEKKVEKKVVKKEVKKEKVKKPKESFFKQFKKELKLVKWPSGKDVLKYTVSTVVFCLFLCAMFMLLNFGLSVVKGWF